jgi:hypothetical protein
LFTRLERYVFAVLATLALWAAVVVAVPAVAQAQVAQAPNNKANTLAAAEQPVVVVDPGDTLWSISSKELGPDAAPWRVARGVERIYRLNREQIGPDPNVLFPGQRLSVPPALSGTPQASEPSTSEPSASGRSAGTEPPARKAAKAASAGDQAGRQAKRGPVAASRQAAASKPAPLPDAAQAAPVPAARQPAAEEPPRSPGESFSFVGEARAAVADATSALVGLFPSDESNEGYTWRELLGAALLAVSSVAFVLAFVLAFTLAVAPKRAKRSQQEDWWREVHANGRAYERAYELTSLASSPDDGLENGTTGAHARTNGTHTNGNAPVRTILAAKRKRGRLRRHGRLRRGRPRSPARHVRRGLAHGTYAPGIRRLLRDASGNGSRRPASRGRLTAAPRRTGVRGR